VQGGLKSRSKKTLYNLTPPIIKTLTRDYRTLSL
jgi:hypothetical protein